jgi:hypothetical protein
MAQTWQVRLVSQKIRRLLVLGCYLGYVALILVWVFVPQPIRSPLTLLVGLMCVLCMGGLHLPNLLGISSGEDRLLDERQQAFRNKMYLLAYQILGALVMVLALYGYIAADSKSLWLPKSELELQAVFWGVWVLVTTLPSALVAWLEPDPLEEA